MVLLLSGGEGEGNAEEEFVDDGGIADEDLLQIEDSGGGGGGGDLSGAGQFDGEVECIPGTPLVLCERTPEPPATPRACKFRDEGGGEEWKVGRNVDTPCPNQDHEKERKKRRGCYDDENGSDDGGDGVSLTSLTYDELKRVCRCSAVMCDMLFQVKSEFEEMLDTVDKMLVAMREGSRVVRSRRDEVKRVLLKRRRDGVKKVGVDRCGVKGW
jgi:hypothetical protein